MKKIIVILVVLIDFSFSANAQNVVIQTNEVGKSETKDDCAYRICGICTTEDLGGVEIAIGRFEQDNNTCLRHLIFENYNSFTVTVIFEVEVLSDCRFTSKEKQTGSIVLKANERKETQDYYKEPSNFKSISRKLKQ